jgi:hypothetical protein
MDVRPNVSLSLAACAAAVAVLMRVATGNWTDSLTPQQTQLKAVHATGLRARLNDVYDKIDRVHPAYTDEILTAGVTTIKAEHVMTPRDAANRFMASGWMTQSLDTRNTYHNDNFALDRIDQVHGTPLDGIYHYPGTGAGVSIYIVTTGEGVRIDHKDFAGRIKYVGDFCNGTLRPDSQSYDPNNNGWDGHDTHVASYAAGTKVGVAKGAHIRVLRASWANPNDTVNGGPACNNRSDAAFVAALSWIANNGQKPAVINFSGGGGTANVREAIINAMNIGYTVTLSGNSGGSVSANWGAIVPKTALVIGGVDQSDRSLAGSAYGPYLALYAPIKGLLGAGMSGTGIFDIPEERRPSYTGDSFAAPLVAGVAALYLQFHTMASPCEVRQAIIDGSEANAVTLVPGDQSPNRMLHVPAVLINTPNCS